MIFSGVNNMDPIEIFFSALKAIGLALAIALVNIQLFWSVSGFIQKLIDLLGM